RNDAETRLDRRGFRAVQNDLSVALGRRVSAMDYPACTKMLGETGGVGHVILVGQKDVADTVHRRESPDQMRDEFWRIHQPVAIRMHHEIAVATKTFARV